MCAPLPDRRFAERFAERGGAAHSETHHRIKNVPRHIPCRRRSRPDRRPRRGVQIGPVHVSAHASTAARCRASRRASATCVDCPRSVFRQANHFATPPGRQHGPELLALATLDLVGAEMSRPVFRTASIQASRNAVRPPRRAPTHGMPHSGVTRWHRVQSSPIRCRKRRVSRAWGSAKLTRSVRMPQCRHRGARQKYLNRRCW